MNMGSLWSPKLDLSKPYLVGKPRISSLLLGPHGRLEHEYPLDLNVQGTGSGCFLNANNENKHHDYAKHWNPIFLHFLHCWSTRKSDLLKDLHGKWLNVQGRCIRQLLNLHFFHQSDGYCICLEFWSPIKESLHFQKVDTPRICVLLMDLHGMLALKDLLLNGLNIKTHDFHFPNDECRQIYVHLRNPI